MSKNNDRKLIAFQVSGELYKSIEDYALADNRSVSSAIRTILIKFLSQEVHFNKQEETIDREKHTSTVVETKNEEGV